MLLQHDHLNEQDKFWKEENAYEIFDPFKKSLIEHHLKINPSNSRRLPVIQPPIGDDAFRRYLDINLFKAFTQRGNKISKPTAAHREYLQRLNGPMISQDDFNELQDSLLGLINHHREKLCIEDGPNLRRTFDPVEEPFKLQQVNKTLNIRMQRIYTEIILFLQMESLGFGDIRPLMDKQKERIYMHWKQRVKETPIITQALVHETYSEIDFQRYYAFIHKFGQTKQYVKSKDMDHENYLKMVKGIFFDNDTIIAMETPLIEEIIRLRDRVATNTYMNQELQSKELAMKERVQQPRVGGSEPKRVCGKKRRLVEEDD